MKTMKQILFTFLLFSSLISFSQEEKNASVPVAGDVIVKTNGNMFRCSVMEVNDSLVKFTLPTNDTVVKILDLPRNEVYAISYGTGPATVITPELMGKEANIYTVDTGCDAWQAFADNLGNGALNIGIGFVNFYSPIKDWKSFDDNNVMPTVTAGYTFKIVKSLKGGVHLCVGGNDLSKSGESEYDQIKVYTEIDQKFFNLGLYCRYDLLKGIFKPYVKAGVDFFGLNMVTTSEATSLSGNEHSLKTVVHQSGIKPGVILRGGMDIYFSKLFGIYGDAGTGLSLVQVGVLFNFE
jgi:hypothetical protein